MSCMCSSIGHLAPQRHIAPRDEIIGEARDDIADRVKEVVADSMKDSLERIIPEVPFVLDIKAAESWG